MSPPKHSTRQRSATRRLVIEILEQRQLLATVGIDLNQVLQTVSADMLGTNATYWQWELSSSRMEQMVRDSGMKLFRMPGGSGSNYNLHFNNPPPYNGYNTAPMIAKFIENVGGDGMVTVNYGTGSPQEAAAYVAYLNAQPGDTTSIGMGQQWNDTTRVWVMKDWKTAGYWAGLRAAAPLGTDDGLNFLRISHPAPFNFTYFEVGNEDFATWEYDKHNLGGTASASSTVGSGQTADMAFDENTATKWVGNWTSSPNYPWLMYQFPNNESRAVRWYTITSSADIATNPGRAPKNWQFQGSNNGTSWVALDTQTNQANTTNATAWTYQTTNTTSYKYYRLNITANNGDASYVEIGDFKLQAADPDTYTTFAKTFSDLAHQIDPTVKVGIDTNQPMQWNMPDLNWVDDCLAMGLQKNFVPGFLSDHTYVTGQSDSNLLLHTVNDPNFKGYQNVAADWAGKAAWYRSKLNADLGTTLAAGVELMETEFNSDINSKQSNNLVGGLWMADAIGGLMKTEFKAALQWDLTNGYTVTTADPSYYGWREGADMGLISTGTNAPPAWGPYIPYPVYFSEQLWSKIVQNGGQIVSANSNDPNLTAYAIRELDGTVGLMVINKSLRTDLNGTFNFTGFTPNTNATYWEYGKAEDIAQSQTSNGSAALSTGIAPLIVDGSSFEYSFPSYSMTVLILSPGTPPTQTPQAPSNLIAAELSSGRINLSWTDNGNSETMFKIERSPNGAADWTQIDRVAANVTTYSNVALIPNTRYYYRVRAYNSLGNSDYSNTADAVTQVDPGGIFTVNGDIGLPSLAGSSSYYNGIYTIIGAGSDIWDVSDQFQYDYKDQTGNATIIARVSYLQNTNSWAKAGAMFRDGTGANAMFVMVAFTPDSGITFQWRAAAGGACENANLAGLAAPQWVKLVRSGNNFSGYYSSDGIVWSQIGSTKTIAMASAAKVGLAVTSHDVGHLCTAIFDNVSVNTAPPSNITVSNGAIAENQSAGTAVGTFSTTDPDFGNTFTYSLVTGTGGTNNASFFIVGNSLRTAALFDYETKNSYSIRVRSTDQSGLSFDKVFTISVTDVSESMIVLPSNLPTTGAANLTLKIAADGKLHIYQTGGTTDIVPPHVLSNVTDVSITGRDGYDEVLTVDISGGNPIPPGGVSFNGGAGGGNSLVVYGTSGNNSVAATDAQQITINGSANVNYNNVAFFGFNMGGVNNSLLIANNAMLKINQDNAISAGANVTIDGGVLDLNGKTDTIGSLLLKSGGILNGTLNSNSYTIESGIVSAAINGPGNLQKSTAAQATTGVVNTSNVTVDAGQLTATSIYANTLTIGAGATVTIAAIPGGPLAADSALTPLTSRALPQNQNKTDTQSTAANAVAPSSSTTTAVAAGPIETSTVLVAPAPVSSEAATMAASSTGFSSDTNKTSDQYQNALTPDPSPKGRGEILLPVRLVESTAAKLIDTVTKPNPLHSPIYSQINSTVLHRIIDIRPEQSLTTRNGNISSTPMLGSLRGELPSSAGKIEKHRTTPAINTQQAQFAALQTVVQNSRWINTDAEADLDIARHVRAGKHSKQLEKAIDEVLAEEDAIPALL